MWLETLSGLMRFEIWTRNTKRHSRRGKEHFTLDPELHRNDLKTPALIIST